MSSETIDQTIERYVADGFRLEMIFPADSPRIAELSRGDERIRVESPQTAPRDGEWHVGRAGMEYRDLIPDRLGGRVIASHIRIPMGGPIPDYVHYHHVSFQIIYCLSGSARLVYEDQGGPFDFRAGDCVLQPPGIRHRVLECSDGFEVFEVAAPAEHPTFVEHTFDLPTPKIDRERDFGGQRFVHCHAGRGESVGSKGLLRRETAIFNAGAGAGDVYILSSDDGGAFSGFRPNYVAVVFVSSGAARCGPRKFEQGDALVLEDTNGIEVFLEPGTELAVVEIGADHSRTSKS